MYKDIFPDEGRDKTLDNKILDDFDNCLERAYVALFELINQNEIILKFEKFKENDINRYPKI